MRARTNIVTEEKWGLVNGDNKKLLDDFMFECKASNKSICTINTYRITIKVFFIWVLDNKDNANVLTLGRRDFQEYSMHLKDRGLSSASHNQYISSVKVMLEYAEDMEELGYMKNTCSKVKRMKIKRVMKKTYLTDDQITKLYSELLRRKNYKEAAYLAISYDSTARVKEIIQIEKYGFEDEDRNNTNYVYKKAYAEPSPVIYFKRTKEAVKMYLEERGKDNIDSLWLSQCKRACTVSAAEYWCRKMSKILSKIECNSNRFTPHDIRRSSINNYHNGTHYMCEVRIERVPYPIQDIQLLANHKTKSMTEYYLKNNKQKNLENAFGIKIVS